MIQTPLERLYQNLHNEVYEEITMYHSDVHYVLAALRDPSRPPEVRARAEQMSVEDMNLAMKREGLLPAYEYGIPSWYAKKWLKHKPLYPRGTGGAQTADYAAFEAQSSG